jgi:nitric oxide reductase activation protein
VSWGYRDIFADAIEELFRQGCLGPQRSRVTGKFFELLRRSDRMCFDHVLHQFLGALNPANRWIMDLPGIFGELVDLGGSLAGSRLYCGIRFFETLAAGGMGGSPRELRQCLQWLQRLRKIDEDLAMAFLAGYRRLCRRLRARELERYVDVALEMHRGNPENACAFLRGELVSCESYILSLTRECRLTDVAGPLRALLQALTGEPCEVADLGGLDSDELLGRGTRTLTVEGRLYLPVSVRRFDKARANRDWYMLCGVVAAALLLEDSFPRVHGHPRYPTCASMTDGSTGRVNLLQVLEFTRVLRRACRRWPGARRLIALGVHSELGTAAADRPERLLADVLDDRVRTPVVEGLRRLADGCVNCFDSAGRLDDAPARAALEAYPAMERDLLRPVEFISDAMFPVHRSAPPAEERVAGLQAAARRNLSEGELPQRSVWTERESGAASGDEETTAAGTPAADFIYDEWDYRQNDYRQGWCHVYQSRLPAATGAAPQNSWLEEAKRVRGVFERLRPALTRREKRLSDGDAIDADRLLLHLVERCREPSPPARFYERPLLHQRDLAVLILVDISGSTGEQPDGHSSVLEIEKQAAIILGHGLAALGDRFAVCGFASNGREKCEYLLFKEFGDQWSDHAVARIMSAWPRSGTRIGPALRHSGRLLAQVEARQRLLIIVTDGKPMDAGYDHVTRYAQHDVRMACEENTRRDVHTFAISTEENSLADMEIMFPRRRFAILPDIRLLPRVLPQMYLRLTL